MLLWVEAKKAFPGLFSTGKMFVLEQFRKWKNSEHTLWVIKLLFLITKLNLYIDDDLSFPHKNWLQVVWLKNVVNGKRSRILKIENKREIVWTYSLLARCQSSPWISKENSVWCCTRYSWIDGPWVCFFLPSFQSFKSNRMFIVRRISYWEGIFLMASHFKFVTFLILTYSQLTF